MFKVQLLQFLPIKGSCRGFSIWNFYPNFRETRVWRLLENCSPCRQSFFPYIFWLVLALSLVGAVWSLSECVQIYCCPEMPIKMWRTRKFYILNLDIIRRGRLIGALIASYFWLSMIYGLISIKPFYILPWLMLNTFLLCLDFVLLLSELPTSQLRENLIAVFQMCRLLCSLILVNCVRGVFEDSIRTHNVEAMRIFGRNSLLNYILTRVST